MGGDFDIHSALCRMARFGANIADAHSCFIFLPSRSLAERGLVSGSAIDGGFSGNRDASSVGAQEEQVELVGLHSLSSDVYRRCTISRGSGLIGWVAKHNRSIHVSPFERDSRTLGTYSVDQQLKSFIGIPVALPGSGIHEEPLVGVIACDSKKAFAFSKVQGKLLEDLANEVKETVLLGAASRETLNVGDSWQAFSRRAEDLRRALGEGAVEIMRLRPHNLSAIEDAIGPERAIQLFDQTMRLIHQALPPHFPVLQIPGGDVLLALDNMMTSFYETKIRAICEHIAVKDERSKRVHSIDFRAARAAPEKRRRAQGTSIAELVHMTNSELLRDAGADRPVSGGEDRGVGLYEYRRAS